MSSCRKLSTPMVWLGFLKVPHHTDAVEEVPGSALRTRLRLLLPVSAVQGTVPIGELMSENEHFARPMTAARFRPPVVEDVDRDRIWE